MRNQNKPLKSAVVVCALFALVVILYFALNIIPKPNSLSATGYLQAYDIARVAVPFAEDGGDDQGHLSEVYLRKQDEYGRQLFLYRQQSHILGKTIDIWLVCQKAEAPFSEENDAYAYYYPDVCYILCKEEFEPNQAAIDDLLKKNDWNKPLVPDKFTKVQYIYRTNYRSLEYTNETLESSLKAYFSVALPQKFMFDVVGELENGKQLVIVRLYTGGGFGGGKIVRGNMYMVLYDTKSCKVQVSREMPDSLVALDSGGIEAIDEFIIETKQQWEGNFSSD